MSDFPLRGGQMMQSVGFDLATTKGTIVTGSATADTQGAFTTLLTAANNRFPSNELNIFLQAVTGEDLALIDIAIGTGGSELVVIESIWYRFTGSFTQISIKLPYAIPAGVRISASMQTGAGGSGTITMVLHRYMTTFASQPGLIKSITFGDNRGDSTGTIVNTSGSINTFGAYVTIVASTAKAIRGFNVICMRAATSWTNTHQTYKVAIGTAGNEIDVFEGQPVISTQSERGDGLVSDWIPRSIPAGSRISITAATSVIAGSDQNMDFVIIGLR